MTSLKSKNPISRRAILPLVAAAALSPMLLRPLGANAEGSQWRIYRRSDLGFEIDMPGEPMLRENRLDGMTTIEAEIDVDQMQFGVSYNDFGGETISTDQIADHYRMTARHLGIEVTHVTAIAMDGLPGLDIVSESDALSMVVRIIVKKKQTIVAAVTGAGALSQQPSVRRFLGSLKLLP